MADGCKEWAVIMKLSQREKELRNWIHSPVSSTLNWDWPFTTLATTTRLSNSSKRRWSWTRASLRRTISYLPPMNKKGCITKPLLNLRRRCPSQGEVNGHFHRLV